MKDGGLVKAFHQLVEIDVGKHACNEEEVKGQFSALLNEIVRGQKKWVIVFARQQDQVDEVVTGSIPYADERIARSLTGHGDGFIVWHHEKNVLGSMFRKLNPFTR